MFQRLAIRPHRPGNRLAFAHGTPRRDNSTLGLERLHRYPGNNASRRPYPYPYIVTVAYYCKSYHDNTLVFHKRPGRQVPHK